MINADRHDDDYDLDGDDDPHHDDDDDDDDDGVVDGDDSALLRAGKKMTTEQGQGSAHERQHPTGLKRTGRASHKI